MQKQLERKILIKNGIVSILESQMHSKNVVPKNKAHILKQRTFVWTKHKTKHKRPICLPYFLKFLMLLQLDTFIFLPKFKSCITPC